MTLLKSQAIQTALLGDWNTAITLNEELLKNNPNDIETLNRLAFAFAISGKIKEAKKTYQKVLDLDSQNPIALKNLRRLKGDTHNKKTSQSKVLQDVIIRQVSSTFLEETGKTKVIELINIAPAKVIENLRTGEILNLCIKRLKIFVLDTDKRYIGMLPDNIGKRLIKFLKGGNHYEAYVKSMKNNRVTIFIKETKRSTRFKNQPSFALQGDSHLTLEKNSSKNAPKHKNIKNNADEDTYSGSASEESF